MEDEVKNYHDGGKLAVRLAIQTEIDEYIFEKATGIAEASM